MHRNLFISFLIVLAGFSCGPQANTRENTVGEVIMEAPVPKSHSIADFPDTGYTVVPPALEGSYSLPRGVWEAVL